MAIYKKEEKMREAIHCLMSVAEHIKRAMDKELASAKQNAGHNPNSGVYFSSFAFYKFVLWTILQVKAWRDRAYRDSLCYYVLPAVFSNILGGFAILALQDVT